MRVSTLAALLMACLLSGCGENVAGPDGGARSPGRYSGIGTYEAGRLWAEMAGVEAPSDPAAAQLADDEQIIVVIDSHTGEVRQCGDYSGICVTMNPWTGPGARSATPVRLNKHAAELTAEDETRSTEAAPAIGEATPGR